MDAELTAALAADAPDLFGDAPADADAAAASDAPGDEAPPDVDDAGEEEVAADDAGAADDEADDAEPEESAAELRARLAQMETALAERQAYEDQMRAWQAQQAEAQTEQQWRTAEWHIWNEYQQRKSALAAAREQDFQAALASLDPPKMRAELEAFRRREEEQIERDHWVKRSQLEAQRRDGLERAYAAARVRDYALEVAKSRGLSQDAANDLLAYHPDQMPREADRMKRERDERAYLKKQLTQAKRSETARQVAATTAAARPSTGRGAAGGRELTGDKAELGDIFAAYGIR